jgi:hypothetical protein
MQTPYAQKAYEHLRECHIDALLTECAYPAVAAALQRGGCGSSSSNNYHIEPDAYEAAVAGNLCYYFCYLVEVRYV